MARTRFGLPFNLSRRGGRPRGRRSRDALALPRRLEFDSLERRTLLTVTSTFNSSTGLLSISSNAADNIQIEIGDGVVLVNSANPNTGPLPLAAVTQLSITAGPGGGTMDIGQLGNGVLPNLNSGTITGQGVTTLAAPLAQANTWTITGSDMGTVGIFSFQDVTNIVGGDDFDTFNYPDTNGKVSGNITELGAADMSFDGASVSLYGNIITHGGNISINNASAINSGGSVSLYGNIYTQGGNLTVYGDTTTVDDVGGPVTISTRDTPTVPGNQLTDQSIGNSGNISFTGVNITLGTSTNEPAQGPPIQTTNFFSQVVQNTQFTPGAISMTADQMAGAGSGNGFNFPVLPKLDQTSTGITLNQCGLTGGAITLTTSAESLHATTDVNTSTPTTIQTGITNYIDNLTILGGLAESTADATINLGPDSSIVGTSLTAMAAANSDAETKPIAIKLGVAISLVTTSATLTAAGKITTTGDTTLDAGAMNTLSAIANAGGNAAGAGAAVAIGVENSTASSIVTSTAQIRRRRRPHGCGQHNQQQSATGRHHHGR